MIPIYLDPAAARIALIGNGERIVRRLAWLQAAGAEPDVWADEPSAALVSAAGAALTRRMPYRAEMACYHVIWIADVPIERAQELAELARRAHVLVNVEDVQALCAFHTPAVVRQGKLTLAAGTGGASPAVARAAREQLEQAFPSSWGVALDEIAQSRAALRENHASFDELVSDARSRLARHCIG